MLRFTDNIIVQMTRNCNMKCKYCYEGQNHNEKIQHINHEQFKEFLDTALYYRCVLGRIENPLHIHFHGGEVLTIPWDELQKDIEYLQARSRFFPNLSWCLQSNGLNINEEIAKFHAQRGISFSISYDGRHSTGRMSKEATDKFVQKLRFFNKEYGLRYAGISVITTENIKYWLDDMREVEDMFDSVGINIICPPDGLENLVPTYESQWYDLWQPVLKTFLQKNPLRERDTLTSFGNFLGSKLFGDKNHIKTGCFNKLCGHGAMTAVTPDFQLHPCDKYLSDGKYSDLINKTTPTTNDFLGLQQIKRYLGFYEEMFDLFKEKGCCNCPAKNVCPGECQAFNISKYGKPKLDEGNCFLYKNMFNFYEEFWTKMLPNYNFSLPQHIEVDDIMPSALKELEENNLKLIYTPCNKSVTAVSKE